MSDQEKFDMIGRLHEERKTLQKDLPLLLERARAIGEDFSGLGLILTREPYDIFPNDPRIASVDGDKLRELLEAISRNRTRVSEINKLLD